MAAVPGQSLAFTLAEALGRAIVSGRFDEDGFPTEAELARRFGASRSIAREVVKMLAAKGLLGSRPRIGTVVQPSSTWHLLDPDVLRWLLDRRASPELLRALAEMRLAFEPEAAGLASHQRPTDAIRRALEGLDAAANDAGDPTAAEVAFHLAVLDAAANPFLSQLKEVVTTAATLSARVTRRSGCAGRRLHDRRLTARAVLSGDAPEARERMRALLLDEAEAIERLEPAGRRATAVS